MPQRGIITTATIALLSLSGICFSAEEPSTGQQSEVIPTLQQVTVVGQAEETLSGTSELSGSLLKALPAKSSSITETINILPRVQLGEGQRTSENAGEILPPLISISGGRAYDNNFTLDGVIQGSLLDPLSDNGVAGSIRNLPSHPQRGFVHLDLIDKITVYDSNIPAKFGGFTGGVIDAETRKPGEEFGGQASLRTTREAWTRFHIAPGRSDDFYNSINQNSQPRFDKYDGGLELDIPLTDKSGLLAAYKLIRSDLDIRNIDDWQRNTKTLENYFLKYVLTPSSPYTLEVTSSYTPSQEDFFVIRTRDSNIQVDRGGYSLSGKLTADLPFGVVEASATFLTNENSRTAPTNHYYWPADTPSKNWGELYDLPYSAEGGYGDIDTAENSFQLVLDILSKPVDAGRTTHTFNSGFQASFDTASMDRAQTTYEHALTRAVVDVTNTLICAPNDPACIDNVYFRERRVYRPEDQDAEINSYSLYLDDLIEIGPVTLRPGARLSYDDFLENADLAYRLAANWTPFKNKDTTFSAGWNRYYGQTFLTYKLREGQLPYQKQIRSMNPDGSLTDWAVDTDGALLLYKYSELDTPYSDEWNVGVTQNVFNGTLSLDYLERDNKDQFAKELYTKVIGDETERGWVLNNNGSSQYQSVKASWERQWQNHYLGINYTYSHQESSNESYDDTFDEGDLDEEVWYDDGVIFKSDLPRVDYNREHMLNLIYVGRLPGNFTFTNTTKFLGKYDALDKLTTSEKTARGIPTSLTAYTKATRPSYWTFDWKIDWEKKIVRNQALVLSLEVNNVFDRTPPAGAADDVYELGRQFWLGMMYRF